MSGNANFRTKYTKAGGWTIKYGCVEDAEKWSSKCKPNFSFQTKISIKLINILMKASIICFVFLDLIEG
jgi:hypothetical protein